MVEEPRSSPISSREFWPAISKLLGIQHVKHVTGLMISMAPQEPVKVLISTIAGPTGPITQTFNLVEANDEQPSAPVADPQ